MIYIAVNEGNWRVLTMKNARRFRRASIDSASCLLARQRAIKGKAKNISPVGVCIRMDEALPVGERIYVNVHLPNYHGSVLSLAEVVWTCHEKATCQTGMGLKFLDLSEIDFFKVDNFVQHYQEC
jgi:c-di-GMP-binding flagellar brake protein YcgR